MACPHSIPVHAIIIPEVRKHMKARFIRIAIIVIGLLLAYWVYPFGLLNTPSGSWNLEQTYRGAATLVICFWIVIFAVNVRD
jgi:hypothetical protein